MPGSKLRKSETTWTTPGRPEIKQDDATPEIRKFSWRLIQPLRGHEFRRTLCRPGLYLLKHFHWIGGKLNLPKPASGHIANTSRACFQLPATDFSSTRGQLSPSARFGQGRH